MVHRTISDLKAENIMIKRVGKILEDATVLEAVKDLFVMNIGALVVVNKDDHIVGIFSERDILRRIIPKKLKVEKIRVSKVMTKNPTTVKRDTSVVDVYNAMSGMNFRHIPVVDNNKCVGIISIKDIAKVCMEFALKTNS